MYVGTVCGSRANASAAESIGMCADGSCVAPELAACFKSDMRCEIVAGSIDGGWYG